MNPVNSPVQLNSAFERLGESQAHPHFSARNPHRSCVTSHERADATYQPPYAA